MAAIKLFRFPCVPPPRPPPYLFSSRPSCFPPPPCLRSAPVVASFAADAAPFSSDSFSKLPRSTRKQKSVAGVDQNNLVDPWLLADQDSRFAELFGVQLHYKIAQPLQANGAIPAENANVPAVLLHGFGASLFSWQRVLKPLAAIIGSSVVAFDRPAFGLTGRPRQSVEEAWDARSPNPYSLDFSARATLSFVDFLHAQQVILIGHSAGCLVAMQAYLDAPEKVAAMILIAPAVTAPVLLEEIKKASTGPDPEEYQNDGSDPHPKNFRLSHMVSTGRNAIWWLLMQVVKVLRIIKAAVQALFQILVPEKIAARVEVAIRSARERLVTAAIRSSLATWAVRVVMDRFGTRGVRMAWYDPLKVDDEVIRGYTKPLQCKDWDRALLEFVLAMAVSPCASMEPKDPLRKRLGKLLVQYLVLCRVAIVVLLVVTGDTDRLVPAWNARRLASALPNAQFSLIKKCGHVPQEETPEELLSIIERFLSKTVTSDSISEHSPVATT